MTRPTWCGAPCSRAAFTLASTTSKLAAGAYGAPPSIWRVVPSLGTAAVAITRSPGATLGVAPPSVPTRIRVRAPSRASSSVTMAALGQPMPVVCTLTGTPW